MAKQLIKEKFKKGVVVNKTEMKRLIDENFDKITMEIRERVRYSDDTEGITIEIRY